MTKILAIDTSSEACSAALRIDNSVRTLFEITPQAHSKHILTQCDKLLAEAQITLADVDAIAFCRGPGSFTGLRISAGVTQGLAYSCDLPIIDISSLEALAADVSERQQQVTVLAIIDARMQEVYWASYSVDLAKNIKPLNGETLSRPDDVLLNFTKPSNPVVGIGSGWDMYQDSFSNQSSPINSTHIYKERLVSAEQIANLAAKKFTHKDYKAAHLALPVYLRNDVAKKPQRHE